MTKQVLNLKKKLNKIHNRLTEETNVIKIFKTEKKKENKYWCNSQNQIEFMNNLFYSSKLNNLDDFLKIKVNGLLKQRGRGLLAHYHNNYYELLTSLYPNYPFDFQTKKQKGYWKSLDNQRLFMTSLFHTLKLTKLDDWKTVSLVTIRQHGGRGILAQHNDNLFDLLLYIYPSHPWLFKRKKSNGFWTQFDHSRDFLISLYEKFRFQSLDEFTKVNKKCIVENGGKYLLSIYNNDLSRLLSSNFPNYPWPPSFDLSLFYNNNDDDDSNIMNNSNLKVQNNNRKLKMKISIPNFKKLNKDKKWWHKIENQGEYMDHLYHYLKLQSLDDWKLQDISIIQNYNGKILSKQYQNRIRYLLRSIYPNFPWNFKERKSIKYWRSTLNQRNFMNELFDKLKLKSIGDFKSITRKEIKQNGGKSILQFYRNLYSLFSTLYPSSFCYSNWNSHPSFYSDDINNINDNENDINNNNLFNNLDYSRDFWNDIKPKTKKEKFLKLINKYQIRKKEDWYRFGAIPPKKLISQLKTHFPNEKWSIYQFTKKSKKSKQRNLFLILSSIFPHFLMLENYRHPFLASSITKSILELDLYFPSLQLAIEYQGEQHFDDFPSTFSPLILYQMNDLEKKKLCDKLQLHLVVIPYWSDLSSHSLLFSLKSFLNH